MLVKPENLVAVISFGLMLSTRMLIRTKVYGIWMKLAMMFK